MLPEPIARELGGAVPAEAEWVEFKHNNDDPESIGEYLSALANSAALVGRDAGYLVWGVEDGSLRVVGTKIAPRDRRIGNEPLENWLAHNLNPRVDFRFSEVTHDGHRVVILRVQPATAYPVAWKGTEWIRVGTAKKRLKEHPGKEKELWAVLSGRSFEAGIAAEATGEQVLALLDYPKYFELAKLSLPTNSAGIFDRLAVDRLITPKGAHTFEITNLGALLFAKQLVQFPGLSRKTVRVVRYRGNNRVETSHEQVGGKGYAAGFEGLVRYINEQLPRNEVLGEALRGEVRMYPIRAVRELVANALIHQDFTLSGTGPMVEIFDDRLEVSNPGLPLIDPLRFIDHSPRSRNEPLADLMRRLGICEERGSGFDKVIFDIEFFQLPPPDIRVDTTHTRVVLFAHQDLKRMDKQDRVRACYQHCCLLFVTNERMTNASLRKRFKIDDDVPAASRIIREALAAELVKAEDPSSKSRKHVRYVPFWA